VAVFITFGRLLHKCFPQIDHVIRVTCIEQRGQSFSNTGKVAVRVECIIIRPIWLQRFDILADGIPDRADLTLFQVCAVGLKFAKPWMLLCNRQDEIDEFFFGLFF